MRRLIIILTIALTIAGVKTGQAFELPNHNYPRLANLFWRTPITKAEAVQLAKWDVLVLGMRAQTISADNIRYIRALNPEVIILAYTSANEIPRERLLEMEPDGSGLWHELANNIKPIWQLKTYDGKNISWWPGNISLNPYIQDNQGNTYGDYLVDFYAKNVLASGLWDGLFLDNIWNTVAWVNENIDIDGDGQKDSQEKINRLWQLSQQNFFGKLRRKIADKYLIVGNGEGNYHTYINGRMFENFPEFYEGGWTGSMTRYQNNNTHGYGPRLNIINSDSNNTGDSQDYQTMRYGLTSALLFDAYYNFDYGPELRNHLWWYDEYDINLGQPKSDAFNPNQPQKTELVNGLWQRDFTNGVVLVNSTDNRQTVSFDTEYERIHGRQDPRTNSGAKVSHLSLSSQDGIILLRPIKEILGQTYANGSFARVFNGQGQNIRNGFFAYDSQYRGSVGITKLDINHNNRIETLVADKGKVTIYGETGIKIKTFFPYGFNYDGRLAIALADLDGDQRQEIIIGPENGQANLIKIFNWYGQEQNAGWHAYNRAWDQLGVSVATGDVDGDGQIEIVVGAGYHGGPHVKVFDKNGIFLKSEFFAYDSNFRGGVNVASGDIDGDGIDEIITGPGPGMTAEVRIFNYRGQLQNKWLAYSENNLSGIKVITDDLDGDQRDEILALTTQVFTSALSAITINSVNSSTINPSL